jgi:AraC family transcriptional regulator of arabinose operon
VDSRVATLVRMFEDSIREERKVSARRLAQSVNLSPSRLRHLFKAEIGTSPVRYLRTRKMQEAKRLLETTFLTVKEVANRVGLSDESHFVRDFKRIYGRPPGHYRSAFNQAATERTTRRNGDSRPA